MTEDSMVTQERDMTEFGSHTGRVIRFFNRKGFGFIHDLNDNQDYFVHNTEIKCKESIYRKLYPGEYVNYNLTERDGKQVCSGVTGILGYPLLVENEDHNYRVYPKEDRRSYMVNDSSSDSSSDSSDSDSSDNDPEQELEPEPEKEFINKEAPEGIEVADFDGLNINEDMN